MLFGRRERRIKRILIVEDEPLVAFDNEHLLRDAGYEVVATVDRVADAIRVIQRAVPDLVAADVQLSGGGSGVDVARAAVKQGVPVLFVTGYCPVDARTLAVGCLTKPYRQRDLLDAIKAIEARLSGVRPMRIPTGLSFYDS